MRNLFFFVLLVIVFLMIPMYPQAGTLTKTFQSGGGTATYLYQVGKGTITISEAATIALDSSTFSGRNTTAQIKYNMTNNAGNFIYCAVGIQSTLANVLVSSISYGGNLMSQVVVSTNTSGVSTCGMFDLVNPPTGSNSVQVNFPTSVTAFATCVTLTGVNTTTPIDVSTATPNPFSANYPGYTGLSLSTGTSVNNDWMADCGVGGSTVAWVANGAETQVTNYVNSASFVNFDSSYRGPLPVQVSSMTYTSQATNLLQPAMAVIAIEP